MLNKIFRIGIDVGSTTVKIAVLDENDKLIYKKYTRHLSNIFEKVSEILEEAYAELGEMNVKTAVTGSGGLAVSEILGLPFSQEVVACSKAIEAFIPETDVAIELGGEDAKITFFKPNIEQRMNGTCAGGTGAFIDQMAVLLNTDSAGLNEAAKTSEIIYPIAARCGVFAKTDIQPLINEGAKIEDLAASIFQAVVNQTITGLACGRTIKGNVAFLGGPLFFLSELRKRFEITLNLEKEQVIFPEDAHYYVSMGAALLSEENESDKFSEVINKLRKKINVNVEVTKHFKPLFETEEDYIEFAARHAEDTVSKSELSEAKGPLYLGIDAGSTTTKAALIDDRGRLLYSFYKNNEGKPLDAAGEMLKELYPLIPEEAYIANTVSTGYGEALIKAAYSVDIGEIETMAHFKAANHFMPGVTFILDIGGQDMKCMMVKDGYIYNILLNEACSSGCGSFIETYAKSMDLSVSEFAQKAIEARNPVDLGTRCTVFMNSKVKQAQKEGASIGDVSAGLSYSVIKNALYKVIKLRNPKDAGDKIVVQGGTFLNDAVLRSIELILERNVVRPDISGIMGAFGAALIGKERCEKGHISTIIPLDELNSFETKVSNARCNGCENHCLLTINTFSGNKKFITGNRCEVGAGILKDKENLPNLYKYKYERLFSHYVPLEEKDAPRGTIGIPRVLNMYENYPFWFTLFTKLGYRVILSPHSSKKIYELGIDTISSDTACYPAKLVHGHIKSLVNMGIKHIFYPSINHEIVEDSKSDNHYNCPIVATYPEVVGNNMDECFEENGVWFDHPFMPYHDKAKLAQRFFEHYKDIDNTLTFEEVRLAAKAALDEDVNFKDDIRNKAEEAIERCRKEGRKIIVLAGRPYHLDPEINHGLDEIITAYGMAVLTEDSVAKLSNDDRSFRVLNQWTYHSRLYRAAEVVSENDDMELIQINSFGCGVDAVTTDQVNEIMDINNKLYTLIKIDEGSNLGAARIRIRSLKVAVEDRDRNGIKPKKKEIPYVNKVEFTKEMKKDYTLLFPQMAPFHFSLMESALKSEGYNVKLLPNTDKQDIECGLKYLNNDACYPTIVSLGQMIRAVQSGKYDTDHLALMMSQTGGGCRASNYIALLRYALKQMGMEHIPVISFNLVGLEHNSGFKMTPKMILKAMKAILLGDLISELLYRVRPYEKVKGSANELYDKCNEIFLKEVKTAGYGNFRKSVRKVIKEFEEFEINEDLKKPRVGVVGEILVKYHPGANNDIVGTIESEGGEAVVPGMFDFFLYGMYNKKFNYEKLAGSYKDMAINLTGLKIGEKIRDIIRNELKHSKRFHSPDRIEELAKKAENILSMGSQCGEGWLLTAEMVELMDRGIENIVCLQPFACLPNHVTGKGMIKPMRKYNELSNIAAIDFDPGASEVNQLNRIKLMMATAFKNMEKKEAQVSQKINKDNIHPANFEEEIEDNESSNYSIR